jgi:RNA polymerase sigma-70 factor (ECF subfamily)
MPPPDLQNTIDQIYRAESRRVLATLIRLLGDFDLAEDAVHDAFRAAIEEWPAQGIPANPCAWLISTGRFKAIDRIRHNARTSTPLDEITDHPVAPASEDPALLDNKTVVDDQLRLIFTCCHPALAPEAQLALTLREVCGLTTEEIARAFLTTPTTLAQRIVRAKNKIREAKIPYEVPTAAELPERLTAVLKVIYLVFNEGYSASSGSELVRTDVAQEALRLGRLLVELLPEPECQGLLALMLLHESRRAARTTPQGDVILLEDQDRTLWNKELIREGTALVHEALATGQFGSYSLQAAISALHAEAAKIETTDWDQIIALYDVMLRIDPSPVIKLNRAVAVAMRSGPEVGLKLLAIINKDGALNDYQWFHSAQADLLRRLGKNSEAAVAYRKALSLTQLEPEKRFYRKRIEECLQ